jgi:hypothetical protein
LVFVTETVLSVWQAPRPKKQLSFGHDLSQEISIVNLAAYDIFMIIDCIGIKFSLEQAIKPQRGSRGIALLFL